VLQQLFNLFCDRCPGQMRDLELALEARNAKDAAQLAHKLKGAVGNFSAPEVFQVAANIEAELRSGNLDTARQQVPTLKQLITRLESDVRDFLTRSA